MNRIGLRHAVIVAAGQLAMATLGIALTFAADPPPTPAKPKTDGRPVYLLPGRVVVLPENVEIAPADYRGALNVRPFAVIKLDGKVAGEVYFAPLKKSPSEEAKGMAASADKNPGMKLANRSTIKDRDKTIECVTLKLERPSGLGNPWILHSLYLPASEGSTTFKLATSEARFEALLPYLHEMLWLNRTDTQSK